eukprot:CCRYP_020912-RA/>CCRYP_020912-RA protein AED:0.44 eAED:0.44 QI:17/1/1/1/1/1/2/161/89
MAMFDAVNFQVYYQLFRFLFTSMTRNPGIIYTLTSSLKSESVAESASLLMISALKSLHLRTLHTTRLSWMNSILWITCMDLWANVATSL